MRNRNRHAPDKMTKAHNFITALSKIDTARLESLDDRMVESIARTHRVPLDKLQARLAQRIAREAS